MAIEVETELTNEGRLAILNDLVSDLERCLETIDALELIKVGALVDEASQICRKEASNSR